MIVTTLLTKSQGEKEKNLPKTQGKKVDIQHLIVIVIPQILSQIQLLISKRIHLILILVPLVMGNTRRGEISAGMGRIGNLDESRARKAGTVEVEDQRHVDNKAQRNQHTEKQSSSLPRQDQIIPEKTTDTKVRRTVNKQSHEEGELSPENGAFVNNRHDTKAEFSEPAKQDANSDDSKDNRF